MIVLNEGMFGNKVKNYIEHGSYHSYSRILKYPTKESRMIDTFAEHVDYETPLTVFQEPAQYAISLFFSDKNDALSVLSHDLYKYSYEFTVLRTNTVGDLFILRVYGEKYDYCIKGDEDWILGEWFELHKKGK